MKANNFYKKSKRLLLCLLAGSMCINLSGGLTEVIAHERGLIKDKAQYGDMYNKELNSDIAKDNGDEQSADTEQGLKEPTIQQEKSSFESQKEIIAKRTEYSKTYKLSNGSYVTEQFFEPVHKKIDGNWIDIDDTLKQSTDLFRSAKKEYSNDDGVMPVTFDNAGVNVNNDIMIELTDKNTDGMSAKENAILYNQVIKNVDVQYDVRSNHVFQNIQFYSADNTSFSYQIHTDLNVEKQEESIRFTNAEGNKDYTIKAPVLKDNSGNVSMKVSVNLENKGDGDYLVTYTADQEFMNDKERAYPVSLLSSVEDSKEQMVDSSYIRSGSPNITSMYEHLLVGYDKDGVVSGLGDPSIIAIARAFFTFPIPEIGDHKIITNAYLTLDKFSDYGDLEVNQIDVYDTNTKVDTNHVNWNNQPTNITKISSNTNLKGTSYKMFDITEAANKMYKGTATSIMLRAADESDSKYLLSFHSESTGYRPRVRVEYRDDYDVDPDTDIDNLEEYFRFYTKGFNNFMGISIDGRAKPYSDVNFDLYEQQGNDKEKKVNSSKTKSDAYYLDPIFVVKPLKDVQQYENDKANYTSDYFENAFFPKKDTLYNFHVYVTKDSEKSKELITDSFLFYEVKLGDNLQTISTHYGVSIEDILKDNNTSEKKIKEGDVLFIRYPHENPILSDELFTPPVKIKEYTSEYKYRGPECPYGCTVGDPINTTTGNFYHQSIDATVQDFEELNITRTFNSYGEKTSSIFGNGFSSNMEQYVSYTKDDNILYFAGDGKIFQFVKSKDGYKSDDFYSVKETDNGIEIFNSETKDTLYFNEYGILQQRKTLDGYKVLYNYDEYGKIKSIMLGEKEIAFEYYPKMNLVKTISLPDGTNVQYVYDSHRRLIEYTDTKGLNEKYNYDKKGRMTSIIDKNGNESAINTYDDKDRVIKQIDGNGNETSFVYGANKNTYTYADGTSETYTFDSEHRIIGIVNSDGIGKSYTYENGMIASETNALGQTAYFTYDKNKNLIKKTDFDGTTESYTYDSENRMISKTDKYGRTSSYQYDQKSNLIHVKNGDGTSITYTYDEKNHVIKEITETGAWKTYEYSDNQVSVETHSTGLIITYTYDAMGRMIHMDDNQGRSISYVYDKQGNVLEKTDVDGLTEKYLYDNEGHMTEFIDKIGGKTTYTYDKNGNQTVTQKGDMTATKIYNGKNRIIEEKNFDGSYHKYLYDSAGNKIEETDIYGNKTVYTYDALGNVLTETDVFGKINKNTYENGLLVKNEDKLGNVTTYKYDKFGQEVEKTLPNGKQETKEYVADKVVKATDQYGRVKITEYDTFGRISKETSETGIVTVYTYDDNNQVLIKTVDDERVNEYTYDVYGNQLTSKDALGNITSFTYDSMNRITQEIDPLGNKTVHIFNGLGNEIEVIDAKGNSEKHIYDINGLLIKDVDKNGYATTYKNKNGKRTSTTTADGIVTTFIYDKYNNLIDTKINNISIEKNTYNQYGQLVKIEKPSEQYTYEYDDYGRKIKEINNITTLTTEYTYDSFDNILEQKDSGGKKISYEYDEYNRMIKTIDAYGRTETQIYDINSNVIEVKNFSNETEKYSFDAYGNLITESDKFGNITTYSYDLNNNRITSKDARDVIITNKYDANGNVIETSNSFYDAKQKFTYDANENLILSIDFMGNETKNEYDANNQKVSVINANGQTTKTEYDVHGNVIKVINADGQSKQIKYNAFGQVIEEVDERGFSIKYHYNDKLLQDEITDKLGKTIKITYGNDNLPNKIKNQNGYTTVYEYDIYGNAVKETDPNGNIKETEYDLLGNVVKVTEPRKETINIYNSIGLIIETKVNGKTTLKNTLDDFNQIVETSNALNQTTKNTYDKYGNLVKTDNEGYITILSYDKVNREVKKVENDKKTTILKYDILDHMVSQEINDKEVICNNYDAVGNILYHKENGVESKYEYNDVNKVIAIQLRSLGDSEEYLTVYTMKYDETGNMIQQKDYYGNTTTLAYDANNNKISEVTARGNETKYEFDALGNMVKVQNPLNRVINYTYDGNNNLTQKRINDLVATYKYDSANNIVEESNEYGYTEMFEYDDFGNLTNYVKPDGTEITYEFDLLGNKLKEGSRTFSYDNHNNLVSASYNGKNLSFEYDEFNRMVTSTDAKGNSVSYGWDIYNNRTSITYPDKTKVSYTYNDFNKITKVKENDKEVASYTFDVRGNATSLKNKNTVKKYTYDEMNKVTSYDFTNNGKHFIKYEYSYDPDGNIIKEVIDGKENTYAFDEVGEIKTSNKFIDGKLIETKYGYDLYGNQTETSSDGKFKIYHYNERNQLTNIKTQDGLTDIYYNKNGNMKEILYAGGKKETLEYDEFDQLIKLSNSKDQSFEYEYDAQGDRTSYVKNINDPYDAEAWYKYLEETPYDEVKDLLEDKNSTDTFDALRYQAKYHADKNTCVGMEEMDENDRTSTYGNYVIDKSLKNSEILMSDSDVKHIYGMDERLFTECGDPKMSYETSVITYLNGLNNSVIGTNTLSISFGVKTNTENKLEYDDFGKTNDMKEGFGYNGEELDGNGLIYLRARYYNPELGRFIQIDRFRGKKEDIESQNRYIYTNNNPYKFIDKTGKSSDVFDPDFWMKVGEAVGAAAAVVTSWTPPGWLAWAVAGVSAVGAYIYYNRDSLRESYENGLRKKNEMIADTLINNETVTISGGSTSWAGSTTLRPTITMTREQYLKEVACQEVKDIYAKKLAQEAEAAQTENEIKKRIEDKLGELDKGSIDTTKNKQRKVTNKDKSGGMDKANKDFDDLDLDNVREYPNGTRVGEFPDGTEVNVRPNSSEGSPTVEVKKPNGKRIKYRYK